MILLPEDVLFSIFLFADFDSLHALTLTSKQLNNLIYKRCELWSYLCRFYCPNFFANNGECAYHYHFPRSNPSNHHFPFPLSSVSSLSSSLVVVLDNGHLCRQKLQFFMNNDRKFSFEQLDKDSLSRGRYLHRSCKVPNQLQCQFPCEKLGTSDHMWLFFGGEENELLNDLWLMWYDESNTKVMLKEVHVEKGDIAPTPRKASTICTIDTLDRSRGEEIYLFAGAENFHAFNDNINHAFTDELWKLNLQVCPQQNNDRFTASWQLISKDNPNGPLGRWGHSCVSYGCYMVVFGGSCWGVTFDDLWVLDCSVTTKQLKWQQIKFLPEVNCPSSRGGHSASVSPDGHMYIFGGNNVDRCFNELWRLDLKPFMKNKSSLSTPCHWGWELINSASTHPPPPGIGHASICIGNNILIYGGRNLFRREFNPHVYLFDTYKSSWIKILDSSDVADRTGHCVFSCSSGIIVLGGLTHKSMSNDVLLLNLFGSFTGLKPGLLK